MKAIKHLEGACSECGGPLRFLANEIGQTDRCPHCGQPTELNLALPEQEPLLSRKMVLALTVTLVALAVVAIVPVAGLKHYQRQLQAQRRAKAASAAATNTATAPAPSAPR